MDWLESFANESRCAFGCASLGARNSQRERFFGLITPGESRSLSPQVHRCAYRMLGLSRYHYLQLSIQNQAELEEILTTPVIHPRFAHHLSPTASALDGLTVIAPFKEHALALAHEATPCARQSGAANLLVRKGRTWWAETTDAFGVLIPLQRRAIEIRGRQAIIIGCGGAGRAAAYGLREAGAQVLLANRHPSRARYASKLLDLPWTDLEHLDVSQCDIVVNATPLGHSGDPPVFAPEALAPHAVVVDFVHSHRPTPLVLRSHAAGLTVIDGREVFAIEVALQFSRMTGHLLDDQSVLQLAQW